MPGSAPLFRPIKLYNILFTFTLNDQVYNKKRTVIHNSKTVNSIYTDWFYSDLKSFKLYSQLLKELSLHSTYPKETSRVNNATATKHSLLI